MREERREGNREESREKRGGGLERDGQKKRGEREVEISKDNGINTP